MSFLRFIIAFVFFAFVVYVNLSQDKQQKEMSDKYLHNNVEFEGIVTGFEQSGNHEFGVFQLKLTKSNVQEFNDSVKGGIFPYRIKGDIAEVYASIAYYRKLNDTLKVISNNRRIYFNPSFSKETEDIKLITKSYDLDFVKENTVFKDLGDGKVSKTNYLLFGNWEVGESILKKQ